ncbi:hypothetical protein [Catalinimonas niigatensis]|uniref:hypothetical protein n=1 Tax=Catalinimonas niigatensis TaxID=1397264 RepID=UPI0026670770|nr:hypothetical protein [Catalinimonas niigatensis]WPP51388.1 hypothetical protein PZB72_03180 [Catalinimonas niigatensis]
MKKARFNYYGRLSVGGQTAMLLILCFVLIFLIMELWQTQEKGFVLFLTASLMSLVTWITNNLITNLIRLECKQEQLVLTHLLTKQVKIINLKDLSGYQSGGLSQSIQLMNTQGETLATIYQPFYKNAEAFLLENGLNPMNREERYFRWLAV